ncbi:probable pectate lyase 5 [Physcomitrium patens]|uniref:Pectate lyase n=1 Tax=Physcomitrium patens TaxID=3218 RepID=A0A2K1KV92_PHYPA|nr:probable pectate lyase 5 [Physcomitrium patens]PNR57712.1 hypothetical protein PHYPA_004706 [Physcomitrium patens]|eukprot:XP_024369921.1 probable pectate lyase 5 [Physcomitrella patens]
MEWFLLAAVAATAWWAHCTQAHLLMDEDLTMTQLPASADLFLSKVLETIDPHYVERKKNSTRRILASANGNPVDDCWRSDSNWHNDRQALADCAIGFGKNAAGGKEGRVYVVTDDSDDNVVNPKEGTLRYGVLQEEPLWIVFDRNMKIKLKNELILTSYKTIDGRGANVHLSDGAGLKIQFVQNIIVHGIHFHNIVPTGPAVIRSSPTHVGHRDKTDGTAIAIFTSHDVWVDHCFFSKADDGLVDAIRGSTRITVSNCYFSNHDKAMLFGAHKQDTEDRDMTVTVAFNHFGPNLMQRLPRMRFGYCHVVNNDYPSGWGMYAIGGSEDPTFLSEGNRFVASKNKEVTKRVDDGGNDYGGEENWNWASSGDLLFNGATFESSGANGGASVYNKAMSLSARPASLVEIITSDSGPLMCTAGDGYCAGNYPLQSTSMTFKRQSPSPLFVLLYMSVMLLFPLILC